MNRLRLSTALTISALIAAVGSAAPAYAAYPTSTFHNYAYEPNNANVAATTDGTFTWYNQSVGVQGNICDKTSTGGATVEFHFHLTSDGSDTPYSTQSRYTDNICRSFNWTEAGPVGGIRSVYYRICLSTGCGNWASRARP